MKRDDASSQTFALSVLFLVIGGVVSVPRAFGAFLRCAFGTREGGPSWVWKTRSRREALRQRFVFRVHRKTTRYSPSFENDKNQKPKTSVSLRRVRVPADVLVARGIFGYIDPV